MRNLVILLPILFSSTLFAQTIDVNWIASPGDSSLFNSIEINSLLDPGPAGMDVVWDFSTLAMGAMPSSFSVQYANAADFGTNSFASISSLAAFNSGNSRVEYLDLVDNQLQYYGDSSLFGSTRVYDPPIVLFSFPMEFDEEINNLNEFIFFDNYGEPAFESISEINRTFDGIGTLITPFDTFYNCIRIKEERIDQPFSPNAREFFTYSWYDQKLSNEMARLATEPFFNRSDFSWQMNLNEVVATNTQSISEQKSSIQYLSNKVFQTREMEGLFSMTVFDMAGKKIEAQSIRLNKEGSHFTLSQSYPSNHLFVLLLVNPRTKEFFVHKFVS